MIPDNVTRPQEAALLDAFIADHPFARVDPLTLWIAEKRDLYAGCRIQSTNAQNVALGLLDALDRFLAESVTP